ncbi:hypothetical protein ONZ51_g4006 [Trametes cubensis]|uniref:Uncharacterized protein n=1 Tax=Trametes cubensis TaxID=1111947 RepID=A0AAD7XAN7_9APHY|nr:hypothetical protein ONZ51_g4006 [Trametes cubensis]
MTESVPDDVLEYILHYALTLPAETFEAWRTPSTFAGSPRSNVPNILLVSMRWHNLGLPSLYEAAILRTVHQGRAFAQSAKIMNERGVRRGHYLRRLRIEGGHSTYTKTILEKSPGLVAFFVSFDVSLDDSFAGLKRALQQVNPLRLFMYSSPGSHATASNTQSLYKAIGEALPCWTKLVQTDRHQSRVSLLDPVDPPLCVISLLSTLEALLDNPAVKMIQIRDGTNWLKWRGTTAVSYTYPRDKIFLGEGINMTPWQEFPRQDVTSPAARSLDLPDLPDKIWIHILGFATHVHGYNYLDVDDALVDLSKKFNINSTRMSILLVNKRFHRLGLGYLYAIPHITSDQVAAGLAARVESSEQLASFVRVLYVRDEVFLRPDLCIRAPLINLVRLNARIRVLLELDKHVPPGKASPLQWATQALSPVTSRVKPRDFSIFPHLRRLTLSGGVGDEFSEVYLDALPRLESLKLYNPGSNIFSVFACMELPKLRELGFTVVENEPSDLVEFLEKHGAKLETISLASADATLPKYPAILDNCPNITELRVDCPELPQSMPMFVVSAAPHVALKRLTFSNPALWIGEYAPPKGVKRWNSFIEFLAVHRHKIPALEEVRTLSRFEWPMHEYARYR